MKVAPDTTAPTTTRPSTLPDNLTPGAAYETNLNRILADHCREEYAALYTLLQAVHRARAAGILEVTLRTRTGTLTLPLTGERGQALGQELGLGLAEMLGDELGTLEASIVKHAKDAEEEPEDEEGTSPRAQTFGFCLPMRPLTDAEFAALPKEARRAYDEDAAEKLKAA